MRIGENIRQRSDGRFEARYKKGRDANGKLIYGFCYGKTYEEAKEKRNIAIGQMSVPADGFRRMNLLILGAGGQGQVVKEIAESIGIFNKISFLDDDTRKPDVIGFPADCAKFLGEYPIGFVSVGSKELRYKWFKMLARTGFIIPTLASPSATISPSASMGYGTLVEPKAIIGANSSIGNGCIISSGAIVERDTSIEGYSHIDYGETVRKD